MTKTHLISGATSGIGQAIAQRLQAKGDRIVAMVRDAAQAKDLGVDGLVVCDFAAPEGVREAVAKFEEPIHSFINCAATTLGKAVFTSSAAEVAHVLNVNLISPMMVCAELKKNVQAGGAILLVSSQSAYRGGFDDAYNVSKGGINTFIKALAIKMAPAVRVFGIAPGITLATRMTRERKADDLAPIREQIPLKRFGDVNELAELVDSLLGPAGAYITGAVIDVNGGNYLR
ncbi:MAG: SDR family oxidoreductase [Rhodospirillaceae bacterium]|nr:SDR family oxidoreductase [Rhodospirillaceae bacterium]